jgi:hypothetical protein
MTKNSPGVHDGLGTVEAADFLHVPCSIPGILGRCAVQQETIIYDDFI